MLAELHQPPSEIVAKALVSADQYAAMYAASVADPGAFWGEQGKRLGATLRAAFEEIAAGEPAVGDVRGLGPMLAMEFVRPGTTTPDPNPL